MHLSFDLSVFTFFILVVGILGKLELSASNMVINTYNLTYMSLVGCAMATSIIVGNYLGKNKASIAQLGVNTAVQITYVYIFIMILTFLLVPHVLIYPFSKGSEALIIKQIQPIVVILFRFVAVFAFFESASIIFSSAIKGAGDTKLNGL
jgi:MATE family multidrug resistance protein